MKDTCPFLENRYPMMISDVHQVSILLRGLGVWNMPDISTLRPG